MIQSVRQDVLYFLQDTGPSPNLSLHFNRLCRGIDAPGEQDEKNRTIDSMVNGGIRTESLHLYRHAFDGWQQALASAPDTICFEMECASPLVVGKGDQNVHEFGISLQLPWGVPVIPGSAIKGVLSAWAAANGTQAWQKSTFAGAGGENALVLFGGRDARGRLQAGSVAFLDAWWRPVATKPFKDDIINVHYRSYYQGDFPSWPDGTDSPVPNRFVTVQPGERFLFALRGPADWCSLAKQMILEAAGEKGFGSKTRTGYGLMKYCRSGAEWRAEMPKLDDAELAVLYEKEKANDDLQAAFAAEAHLRKASDELKELFKRFRPAALLLEELKEKNPGTLKGAKQIRDRYGSALPNKNIDVKDPDVQAVFAFCLPLTPGGNPEGTWLAAFQYGAEHVLEGLSAEAIQDLIVDYDRSFPPIEHFEVAIRNRLDLSASDKEECLGLLAEAIKEREGQ